MKRLIRACATLVIGLVFASVAMAQNGRVSGQVMDTDGKPWEGVTIAIKGETGRIVTTKTDKDGKFSQIGLTSGLYTFTLTEPTKSLNYSEQHQIVSTQDNTVTINFKEIMAQQAAAHPEEQKKQEEAANAFKEMQTHFNAGRAALDQYDALHKQLLSAPADQKGPIEDQIKQGNQTAITELELAEKGVQPKDVKNHAVVWASLGQAYDHADRYDDAVGAYQKASDLVPSASYYLNMSTAQARVAAAQTDPAAATAKMGDAGADCDKAAALDPTSAGKCWKNIGIILSNKGDLKNAIPPLQKATQVDPKDAQSWYLLGSAYTGTIDSQQQGDKMVYVIPPGTADAYQKCIDADPTGPYAAQAKSMLDSLTAMGGGESTSVGTRAKPQPKKK